MLHPAPSFIATARRPGALVLAAACLSATLSVAGLSGASAQPAAADAAKSAPRAAPARGTKASGGPSWTDLTASQRQSLQPLAGQWAGLSEAQKRKWIALSRNYSRLPPAEQAKLHSRMAEWVALSPRQRTEARLNFADTRQLSPDDKRAKWEAYQALSPEEKQKLAARAAPKPKGAATAVKPVPPQKLVKVPKLQIDNKGPARPAGPLGPARQVDNNTLLPKQAASQPQAPAPRN